MHVVCPALITHILWSSVFYFALAHVGLSATCSSWGVWSLQCACVIVSNSYLVSPTHLRFGEFVSRLWLVHVLVYAFVISILCHVLHFILCHFAVWSPCFSFARDVMVSVWCLCCHGKVLYYVTIFVCLHLCVWQHCDLCVHTSPLGAVILDWAPWKHVTRVQWRRVVFFVWFFPRFFHTRLHKLVS